jgi:hypothetical protein
MGWTVAAKVPCALQGARIVGERYVRAKRQETPEGRMPLMDHLREPRNRLLKAIIVIVPDCCSPVAGTG